MLIKRKKKKGPSREQKLITEIEMEVQAATNGMLKGEGALSESLQYSHQDIRPGWKAASSTAACTQFFEVI